jgi:hypothetical protein
MIAQIKDIALYIVLVCAINIVSFFLESDYLIDYLKDNLITIILTLLAINTATSGLIVSKLQEIKKSNKEIDIKPTTKSLLNALKEQIILIIVAIVLVIVIDSLVTSKFLYTKYIDFFLEVLAITVFINAIQILWDTGKAIFVMIDITDE